MTSTWLQLSCWVWLCPWQCLVYVVCTGWVSVQISRLLKLDDHSRYKRIKERFVCLGSVLPPVPAVKLIIVSMLQHAWICGRFEIHKSLQFSHFAHDKVHLTRAKSITIECLLCHALPRYRNIRSWTEGIDQERSMNCDQSLLSPHHDSDIQVNWTMNERGHDEEAQSDFIFWQRIARLDSTNLWLGMWSFNCNGGDSSKRAAVFGARTSKKLRCVGSTGFVYHQLCIVPW